MSNFKVGDIVECVEGGLGRANEVVYAGNRYTVAEYSGRTLKVDEMSWKWCTSRFKKVENKPVQNIKEVKSYETKDGEVFTTKEQAEAYLCLLELKGIQEAGEVFDCRSLMQQFNITRK